MKARLTLLAFGLALLTMISFGVQAQERAAAQKNDDIIASEQDLARRFADFQDALLKLKQRLARGTPEERKRAEVLEKVLDECKTLAINQEFTKMIEILRTLDYKHLDKLGVAGDQAETLARKVGRILEIMQNSRVDLSDARKNLQKILEDLERAIQIQRQVQAQTELKKTDSKELTQNQKDASKKAEKVAQDIDKLTGKDGKGGEAANLKGQSKEGKGEGAKGEAKNAGEQKGNEAPRGEARDGGKDPKGQQGAKGEAKPSDSKGQQGAKGNEGEPKSGAKPGGEGSKGQDTPKTGAKPGDNKGAKGNEGSAKENKGGDKSAKGNEGGAKDAGDKKGDPKSQQGAAKPSDGGSKKSGDSKPSDSAAKPGGGEAGGGGEPKVGGPKTPDGGAAKGGDAKGGDAKGGDGQGDAKSGDSKDGQGSAKDGGGPANGGGGSPPPGGSAKDSPPPGGGGQPPPPGGQQDQDVAKAGQKVKEAGYDQKIAEEKIPQKDNEAAAKAQADAIKKMEEAKKKLEQLLRQMREEEIERVLAALQARCEKMYIMQLEVLAGTEEVDKTIKSHADKLATQKDKVVALNLSDKEKDIVKEADKCIDILESEGTAVAFPEVFQQLRDDMKHVQKRLGIIEVGTVTQDLEKEIIVTLKEMIDALKKARDENQQDPGPPGKGGKGGKAGDQKLLELLQELKMVRSLQKRINDRTLDRARQYKGEQANDQQVVRELRALAERQLRIQEIVANIVKGASK
jgi:hypothetical protein